MKALSRETILRERWIRGRLQYKFHQGQIDLYEAFLAKSLGQIFVNECGRQFGKTYFWAVVACITAITLKRAKIKIGTAFHTDLVEFIIPAFQAVLEDCPDDLQPIFKSSKSKFIFSNGSEIQLVGLDRNPNKMRGNVIDLIIIDEAGFTDKLQYLYKSVIIPATTHRPNCRIAMSSSTPREEDHEFFEFIEKAEFEGAYIRKTIHDNPMVTEETVKRLAYEMGGEESDEWKREYLCIRIRDKNLTIIPEWEEKYIYEVARDAYYPFYHKYGSLDLGVRDHTALLLGYYDFHRASLIVEDEFIISGPDMTTRILQAHIKDKEMLLWLSQGYVSKIKTPLLLEDIKSIENSWSLNTPKVYLRVSDNNNPLLNQDLSHDHKIHFMATDKGSLEEMINAVKMLVREGRIIVHPRCKQLIGCLKYGIWDKHRLKFAHSKTYGHFDALASLIYLVRNLNKNTNPIPLDFQVDRQNQILFKDRRMSGTASSLKSALGLRGR